MAHYHFGLDEIMGLALWRGNVYADGVIVGQSGIEKLKGGKRIRIIGREQRVESKVVDIDIKQNQATPHPRSHNPYMSRPRPQTSVLPHEFPGHVFFGALEDCAGAVHLQLSFSYALHTKKRLYTHIHAPYTSNHPIYMSGHAHKPPYCLTRSLVMLSSAHLKIALAQCICSSSFSLFKFVTKSQIIPSLLIARRQLD